MSKLRKSSCGYKMFLKQEKFGKQYFFTVDRKQTLFPLVVHGNEETWRANVWGSKVSAAMFPCWWVLNRYRRPQFLALECRSYLDSSVNRKTNAFFICSYDQPRSQNFSLGDVRGSNSLFKRWIFWPSSGPKYTLC